MNSPKIAIKEFTLTRSGTYHDQINYAYKWTHDRKVIDALINTLNVHQPYPSNVIGPMVADSLTLVPFEKPTEIINGWDTPRLFFTLHVEHQWHSGGLLHQYIQGYTDRDGLSETGELDPSTLFIINSCMMYREVVEQTPTGPVTHQHMVDASTIMHNCDMIAGKVNFADQTVPALARPEDLFTRMTSFQFAEMRSQIIDTRTVFNRAVKSHGLNDVPSFYVTRMLESYHEQHSSIDWGNGPMEVLDRARCVVQENMMHRDPFFSALKSIDAYLPTDIITLQKLKNIQPDIKFSIGTESIRRNNTVDTVQPPSNDLRVVKAHLIHNAVTGLMRECGFTEMRLTAGNRTPLGRLKIDIVSSKNIMESSDTMQRFSVLLADELNAFISLDNTCDFHTTIMIDLAAESIVTLSLNYGEEIEIVIPVACSGLLSPVICETSPAAEKLAVDFKSVIDDVISR